MKSSLAVTVVFACALVGHAPAGVPTRDAGRPLAQQPDQTAPQPPEQTAPPANDQTSPETPAKNPQQPSTAATPEEQPKQEPQPQPAPATPQSEKPTAVPAPETGTRHEPGTATAKRKAKKHKVKKSDPPPSTIPAKKVVQNGGTSDPEVQFSPRLSEKQQTDRRQKLSDLLALTDANLQKVAQRQLKVAEEEMVQQIKMYMEQARQASKEEDLQRAENLASKAHLLSNELVGK
jgi:hypothetical protein